MLFESDYIHADLPKRLPPMPVRVSCRSQLTAALRQHARPIVIEDQELARPFARLLRVRNCDCRRLVNSSRIRCPQFASVRIGHRLHRDIESFAKRLIAIVQPQLRSDLRRAEPGALVHFGKQSLIRFHAEVRG
jgi:hypothetical protein